MHPRRDMITEKALIDKENLMQVISQNIDNPQFVYFLQSLLTKYTDVKDELDKVDYVIEVLCNRLGVPKERLVGNSKGNSKNTQEKALFFYILNKELGFSYRDISNLFDTPIGTVHRMVDEMKFLVEKKGNKPFVSIAFVIHNDLNRVGDGSV